MPSSGLWASSPIGSAISSGLASSSAAAGTNCRAMGSCGSAGSMSSATSAVSASAERAATASISPRRPCAINPAAAGSSGRRRVLPSGFMTTSWREVLSLAASWRAKCVADAARPVKCQSASAVLAKRALQGGIPPARRPCRLAGRQIRCWYAPRNCASEDKMKNYLDGGEAILEAFRKLKIDYIMSSPGSEWSPIGEALARQKLDNKAGPTFVESWHETLAVNMATGYTLMTGRPQAVLLHAGVGVLQGSMGIHGALQNEVPMVVMSGESQTLGEDPALDIEPQWYGGLTVG